MIEFREKSDVSSDELENDEWLEPTPVKTHPISAIFVIGVIFLLFLILKRSIF